MAILVLDLGPWGCCVLYAELTNVSCRTSAVVRKSVTLYRMGETEAQSANWKKASCRSLVQCFVMITFVMLMCRYTPELSGGGGRTEDTWEIYAISVSVMFWKLH